MSAIEHRVRPGQAMVELILVMPLLLLFLGGFCGIGALLFHKVKMAMAVREAALLISEGQDLSSVQSWVRLTYGGTGLFTLRSSALSLTLQEEAAPTGGIGRALQGIEFITGDLRGATAELIYVEPMPTWMRKLFGPVELRERCTMLRTGWTTRREPR